MVSSRRKKSLRARPLGDKAAFWIDIAIRFLLGCGFAFVAGAYFTRVYAILLQKSRAPLSLEPLVDLFSILMMGFFAFFIAYLYAIRLRPVTKFAGIIPAITAVLGSFIAWGLILLPQRMDLTVGTKLTADFLILGANVFAIYALRHLGRSFSILPEGRELVTTGPYHYMRHPLYVAEAFATTGAMIHFLSPAAVGLVVAQILLQFGRMHYEEKVLRATFPGYAAYSRRTARIIPGIY